MTILNVLLEITVYSAILFAVTLLFKKLFKGKLSPALHLAVWMLLIMRLMLPVTFDASVHFFTLPGETIQLDNRADEAAQTETTQSLQPRPEVNSQPTTALPKPYAAQAASRETMPAPANSAAPLKIDWAAALIGGWIAGMVVCAGMAVCGYSRIRRKLRRDAMQPPEALEALFDECRSELKVSGCVRLSVQRFTQSPALLFPSMVLVPVSMLEMAHENVKLALMHELTHFKRKDQLFAMLLLALRIVYWFNPVVHLAERIIRDDIETACDSSVTRRLSPVEKGVYARSLIAMYNSVPETQMVLGMALGGTRKGAEKRIRGIYMKQKSQWHVKLTALLLAGVMIVCCFTTACQPTPDKPVIVNKVEDIPKEAILETVAPLPVEKNTVEPVVYSANEHWTESVKKNDVFSIEVDADILMPEAAAYPVERLERVVLTQEKVNDLIAFFTEPGTKFYSGEYVRLKSEYEEELINLKKSLQDVLNGGDGETPESIRGYIKEVESKLAKAPETHTYTYVEPIFTYETDYETGEPRRDYGEDTINVSIELPDGSRYGSVYATRYGKGKINRSSFAYSRYSGGCDMESYFTWYDEELKREMENRPPGADKDGGLWDKDMARQREFVDAGLESMKKNNIDLRVAADKAVGLLEELGIEGMQLKSYEKAMFSRERGNEDNTIPGCYVEFVRECGGIPSLAQRGGGFSQEQDYSELYCAPFDLEGVTVLISEEGVESFSWSSMAQVVERVAEDTTLMPIDDMKQRILDHIYFMSGAWPDQKKRVNIKEMRLVTTYINAKDDPERVLIVPAWHIKAQEEMMYDQSDKWSRGNEEEFMINAIDGTGILMPGILEMLQNREERLSNNE